VEKLGTAARPLRIAIIGAGPAGLYAAEALLKHTDITLVIDVFNRFPTPFGLVRDGVAPDHQSIKSVIRVFDRILADGRVRYFGNVTFGVDIHHDEVKELYDQIIYAVGAQSDRHMGIPGEDLPNSFPATKFVGWYNGHPDYRNLPLDLSCERAIVVGTGNVAMDVARILVTSPDELAKTDIADHALARLRDSKIREVIVLGRRGAAQAAFTNPEIREFGKLEGVDCIVDPNNIGIDPISEEELAADRSASINVEILRQYAARTENTAPRRIVMRFLASPAEIIAENGRITSVKIERNRLVVDANGGIRAKGTGEYETIEAGLILRSIGYRSVRLEGVPFDEATSTFSNIAGRLIHANTGETVAGEYVVGWAKRGPSGLIGNNKSDSIATVESMLADLPTLIGINDVHRYPAYIFDLLYSHKIDFVTYEDWKKLDQYETEQGKEQGRPRVKVTSVSEMMSIIRNA
jgi:ferredoxin/flavodoxin---NADP+ reductase